MCALRGKTPRTLSNVRGVLRRCVATKELYPLRRQSGYLLKAKGVTVLVTPFSVLLPYEHRPNEHGVLNVKIILSTPCSKRLYQQYFSMDSVRKRTSSSWSQVT